MRTKWEKTVILFTLKSCSYCAEEFLTSELGVRQRKEKRQQTGMQKYKYLESCNLAIGTWFHGECGVRF